MTTMTTQQQQQEEDTSQGNHHHQQPQQDTTAQDDDTSPSILQLPRPTKSEVHSCQFSKWYPTFRNISKSSLPHNGNTTTTSLKLRKNVTIESHIITPLPQEFIEYLLSDGVRLPLCAGRVSSCMKDEAHAHNEDDDGWNDSDDNNDDNSSNDDDNSSNSSNSSNEHQQQQVKQYNFPTLTSQIHSTLQSLGNNGKGLMPKLNWSSPKDATWMNCGTLKCTTVGDVYLLLKSSEFVTFDLERAWDGLLDSTEEKVEKEGLNDAHVQQQEEEQGEESVAQATATATAAATTQAENEDSSSSLPPTDFNYELVLRKWCNLHPSMEFRCFIYNHQLIAISQRHPTKFYKHLQQQQPEEEEEEKVHPTMEIIHAFYETYVQHRFANGTMHRYVMDVYVDSQERTWIVDFNVWGTRTDALLFDWAELSKIGQGSVEREVDDVDTEMAASLPEWRVVTKDMKDLTYDPLSSFRGPTDVMNLMGGGGGAGGNNDGGFDPSSFQNFMEQCVRPSEM